MDTTTAEVLTELIKIMGPATVTAFVAYKVTKFQLEIKLKEIEKDHEFRARERLSDYYRARQERLENSYVELNGSLGTILGHIEGTISSETHLTELSAEQSAHQEDLTTIAGMVGLFYRTSQTEIRAVARDMEHNGLRETEDYAKLTLYLQQVQNLEEGVAFEVLRRNIFTVMDVYHFLMYCNQLLLHKQQEGIFAKYIEAQ